MRGGAAVIHTIGGEFVGLVTAHGARTHGRGGDAGHSSTEQEAHDQHQRKGHSHLHAQHSARQSEQSIADVSPGPGA